MVIYAPIFPKKLPIGGAMFVMCLNTDLDNLLQKYPYLFISDEDGIGADEELVAGYIIHLDFIPKHVFLSSHAIILVGCHRIAYNLITGQITKDAKYYNNLNNMLADDAVKWQDDERAARYIIRKLTRQSARLRAKRDRLAAENAKLRQLPGASEHLAAKKAYGKK